MRLLSALMVESWSESGNDRDSRPFLVSWKSNALSHPHGSTWMSFGNLWRSCNVTKLIAVEEGFNHGRSLVPGASDLSETFGLDDVLAVDMGTADGIKHVARLIVRR